MCQYSADDGCANDWHLMHLGMLANSGAAMVVVEATHVERSRPHHPWLPRPVLRRQRSGAGPRHRQRAARRHRQIRHPDRACRAARPRRRSRGKAAIGAEGRAGPVGDHRRRRRCPGATNWHTPREATEADLDRVRDAFVASTKRALRIGFDEIELHMAHGYLLHGFMSPIVEQAHRPVWRLAGKPAALSAVGGEGGARRGAEGRAARRAHHRQRLARRRPDAGRRRRRSPRR